MFSYYFIIIITNISKAWSSALWDWRLKRFKPLFCSTVTDLSELFIGHWKFRHQNNMMCYSDFSHSRTFSSDPLWFLHRQRDGVSVQIHSSFKMKTGNFVKHRLLFCCLEVGILWLESLSSATWSSRTCLLLWLRVSSRTEADVCVALCLRISLIIWRNIQAGELTSWNDTQSLLKRELTSSWATPNKSGNSILLSPAHHTDFTCFFQDLGHTSMLSLSSGNELIFSLKRKLDVK